MNVQQIYIAFSCFVVAWFLNSSGLVDLKILMSSSIWEERDVLGTMSQSHRGRIVNADRKVFSHKLTNQPRMKKRGWGTIFLYYDENIEKNYPQKILLADTNIFLHPNIWSGKWKIKLSSTSLMSNNRMVKTKQFV